MSTVSRPSRHLIRQARLAQALTTSWMVVELVVALAAGIAAHSVALTAFGIDSGIEIFTSLVVLRQLLLHTDHASDEDLDRRERQASRLVGWALYGLIVYTVVVLVVMPVLWRWRLGLARRLHSPALRGDAACSLVCVAMATTLLVGLLLNSLFGWWWADPLAALAMIWWIRGEANEALEAARTGRRDDD
jgi:divalent metal cation (Fe/Co/Zn/Cd) transporter